MFVKIYSIRVSNLKKLYGVYDKGCGQMHQFQMSWANLDLMLHLDEWKKKGAMPIRTSVKD